MVEKLKFLLYDAFNDSISIIISSSTISSSSLPSYDNENDNHGIVTFISSSSHYHLALISSFSQALTTALHLMVVICVIDTHHLRPSNDISIACDCIYLVCSVP